MYAAAALQLVYHYALSSVIRNSACSDNHEACSAVIAHCYL
jgi:hypothetical protein